MPKKRHLGPAWRSVSPRQVELGAADRQESTMPAGSRPRIARMVCQRPYTTAMPTDSTGRRAAVNEFVRCLRRDLPDNILDLRLFGSEARGDATPESDIDVLVVVQPEHERAALETRVVDIAFDVNLEFNVFISPSVTTPAILNHPVWRETPFIQTVLREGVPL